MDFQVHPSSSSDLGRNLSLTLHLQKNIITLSGPDIPFCPQLCFRSEFILESTCLFSVTSAPPPLLSAQFAWLVWWVSTQVLGSFLSSLQGSHPSWGLFLPALFFLLPLALSWSLRPVFEVSSFSPANSPSVLSLITNPTSSRTAFKALYNLPLLTL